jgi:hypothetical protein
MDTPVTDTEFPVFPVFLQVDVGYADGDIRPMLINETLPMVEQVPGNWLWISHNALGHSVRIVRTIK